MKNIFKTLLLTAFALICTYAYAQPQKITAILLDRETGEPLPYATVSVIPSGSKTVSKYVLSSADGKVVLSGVKNGSHTLKVELMGYRTYTQEIKVNRETLDLGALMIATDRQVLDAAKVSDVGNPIVVKKDTIEYNASSFKTSDNDMLIDLLKKLPGIEVEADGTITANGETVKKITIDGKTFFLDDPQLATKNIPSKVIEKVKVVERKSDQAQFTGIDDGEEETIIDLKFRKGMFKGWFGNIMGGGGHDVPTRNNSMDDWRYQGAGFVGNFTDKQQISVVLNVNNTNNRGFNDMAGSMMGNMRGGRGMGRGGNTGITTSWMGGVNGAWTLLNKRMDLSGNYLYSGSDKVIEEESTKNTFLGEGERLNYHTKGTNFTNSNGHRIGVRLDHKFSDNTSILFEPRFNIGHGYFNEYSSFDTNRENTGTTTKVNEGFNENLGWNKNWTASGWGLLRQKLGKPGRTLTVNFNYNFSNNTLNGFNQSWTDAFDTGASVTTAVNQKFDQNSRNTSVSGGLTYTEPLFANWYLEANYNYSFRKQDSDKQTYNIVDKVPVVDPMTNLRHMPQGPADLVMDDTYSRDIRNISHAHRAGANIMYQFKKFRAQLGVTANPTSTYNYTNSREYYNKVVKWAPQGSLSFDISENSNLRMFYRGMSEQPSVNQLMPVPDNSDPTNISLGNPYLTPYFIHRLRGMFRYTNKKTFTSVNAYLFGNITQNPIMNTSWYESDGTQFNLPSNGPTSFNGNLRVMVNSPIAKSKFSIFSMTRLSYSNTSNYIKTGNTLDMTRYYTGGDKFNFDYEKFHNDIPSLGEHPDFNTNKTQTVTVVERLRLTYRSDIVELTLGGRARMNKGWYTIAQGNTNTTWSNQADASMNWTIPGGVNLIAQAEYNWYRGYTTPQESTCVLNAEITKLLFKNKFTLALKGYDLLGQARNLSVADTDNYHNETINNTLGRYIILSLTYRFGTFDKNKMRGGHGFGGHRR